MKIAILGGGHGAYAAAADLSEAGHEVRLWRRDAAALEPVLRAGAITLKDAGGAREVPLALATADIATALKGAELIVIPCLLYTSPSPRDRTRSRMPSSA